MKKLTLLLTPILLSLIPNTALARSSGNFTNTTSGIFAVAIFVIAYILVILEEKIKLKKSVPVITAAGIIWFIIASLLSQAGDYTTANEAFKHAIVEFAELLLFLLVAMTFINSMQVFDVFEAIRAKIIRMGLSLRGIFWVTGLIAFFLSPVADNLTTALVMGTIVLTVAKNNKQFISIACLNIVVAANAGGAFSPFGDITTLMMWQSGKVRFMEFMALFIPSIVNWLIPAIIMSFFINNKKPEGLVGDAKIADGGYIIIGLFTLSIIMAVSAHNIFHMPPVLGMMTGLGLLQIYAWLYDHDIRITKFNKTKKYKEERIKIREKRKFDIFKEVERAEWDTLLFFYGVVVCVGGLGSLGYMALLSDVMYNQIGIFQANILIGLLSAIVDNIPVMFAVLTMDPQMNLQQWLLVTLTAGTGGSLLSIGSAAGVAMMGQARGYYTFFSHLKWSWAIALGYGASIWVHTLINGI
ncbi:MAG: sodium:proton antiporter NhaD [Alphaproteobacteria bacterium]|nr:sodium:proton antiporter NhaD [Alphaproteobacteria bacterium]